jgi:hypothetical protein
MRFAIPIVVFVALCLGSIQANAASCSGFVVIKSYDADASTVEIAYTKGKEREYFPKPEGTPRDRSKIPSPCRGKVKKETQLAVKATGGKMSITQVRSNYEGKMKNDTDDASWLPNKLNQLIADKTTVVAVMRPMGPGRDAPLGITTIYLPADEEDLAEIKRIEDQAVDE